MRMTDLSVGLTGEGGASREASSSGGRKFTLPRIFSEPVIRIDRRADFHIENCKWRTKRFKRGKGRDDAGGAGTSSNTGLAGVCSNPLEDGSIFPNDPKEVYRPTTTCATSAGTSNGCFEADGMTSNYREEMSESDPLRGNEEWNGIGEEARANIWKRHASTLVWAIFLGTVAVSVLILAAVLAIILEYKNAGNAVNITVNDTLPLNDSSTLSTTLRPGMRSKLSLQASPLAYPLKGTRKTKPGKIDAGASGANDFARLSSSAMWPISDTKEKASREFATALKLGTSDSGGGMLKASGSGSGDNNVQQPVIVPIPLFQTATATSGVVQQGLTFGQTAVDQRQALEAALSAQGYTPKSGYPGAVYSISTRWASPEGQNRSLAGFLMDKASQRIAGLMNLTRLEAQQGISVESMNGIVVHEFCEKRALLETQCNISEIYRSYDGTCNNLEHVRWGASFESFRRILYPDYADGISAPRTGLDGNPLPTARTITTTVFQEDPVGEHTDKVASYMLVLWAQFVNHDVAFAPSSAGFNGSAIPCCVNGKLVPSQHPECLPVPIGKNDSFYAAQGQECLNFVRSSPAPVCEFGPREQMNQITSYLDASHLYGSTATEFKDVISFFNPLNPGRLPETYLDDGRPLPARSTDLNDGCNIMEAVEKRNFCFKTADRRINEYTGLTAMNGIWTRQHNLIAAYLVAVNPHWEHERAFEETRRVIIAQIQHITYNEFLPVLLGPSLCKVVGISLTESGYYEGYDPEINPTISNAFEAAAFRMGHSMIQGIIKMIGPKSKNEDFIQVHKLMYNPFRLYELGRLENLIRGHAAMPAAKADLYFSNQIKEHVFQLRNNTYGLDLPAMDIQRGRDHGIPGYLQYRRICNLTVVNSYEDLKNIWPEDAVTRVSQAYSNIEDIDLYTGGLAETAIPEGLVGPTFACILADQFLRLRKGDRFWYENSIQLKPFSPEQLQVIRKTTLAQVLCANTDYLDELQGRVMVQSSLSNPPQPCSLGTLGPLDFTPWKEIPTLTQFSLKAIPTQSVYDYADEEDRIDSEENKALDVEGRNKNADEGILLDFSAVSPPRPKNTKSLASKTDSTKQGTGTVAPAG